MLEPATPFRRTAIVALTLAVALTGSPAPPAAAQEDGGNLYRRVLEQHAEAVVTIRFVLAVEVGGMSGMMGDGQEIETEITGLVIDPGGLIVCSNTQIGGFAGLLSRLMGSGDLDISATPDDIEVLIGDATEGVPARLVARDSELDLAWLQIEEPGDTEFAAVDLEASVAAEIGEPFVALRRMDKVYARAPALLEGRIGGAVTKPRRLYIPATAAFDGYGLPVFNARGELLGVTVVQFPEEEETTGGGMAAMFQSARMQEMLAATILPAAEVSRATGLARDQAARSTGGEDGEGESDESDAAADGDGDDAGQAEDPEEGEGAEGGAPAS